MDSTKIYKILSRCWELADAKYVIADGVPIKMLIFNMTLLLLWVKHAGRRHRPSFLLPDIHARSRERVTGPFFR
jgi:hypothetical protein